MLNFKIRICDHFFAIKFSSKWRKMEKSQRVRVFFKNHAQLQKNRPSFTIKLFKIAHIREHLSERVSEANTSLGNTILARTSKTKHVKLCMS